MTRPGEVGPEDVLAATIDTDTTKRFRRTAPVVVCRNGCSGDLARTYVDQRSGWRWLRIGPTHGRDQQSRSATRTPSAHLIDTPDGSRSLAMVLCRRCRSGTLLLVGAGQIEVTVQMDAPTHATVVE